MSARNTLAGKRARREKKALRNTPQGYINLIDWIRERSSVTKQDAAKLLLAGVLRVDSHKVGYKVLDGERKVLAPFVTSDVRGRITLHDPEPDAA